eukprot:COSAG01_NODE_2760_length_7120_cov_49.854253_8_plen_134_part_00
MSLLPALLGGTEPHFGVPFARQPIDPAQLQAWAAAGAVGEQQRDAEAAALQLPPRNEFIATDFELLPPCVRGRRGRRMQCNAMQCNAMQCMHAPPRNASQTLYSNTNPSIPRRRRRRRRRRVGTLRGAEGALT